MSSKDKKKKKKYFNRLKEQHVRHLGVFKGFVTWLDFKVLRVKITKSNEYKSNNVKAIHKNKLRDLEAELHSGVEAEKVVSNFPNRILTTDENVFKINLGFLSKW